MKQDHQSFRAIGIFGIKGLVATVCPIGKIPNYLTYIPQVEGPISA
jgi:hypothetical protein